MNRVFLVGNTGGEPEVINFENGGKIVKMSLATSETWKDKTTGDKKERTEWHALSFRRPGLVDVAEKWIKKGHKLAIEGTLRYNMTEKDGEKKYFTSVDVDSMEMLTPKPASHSPGGDGAPDDDLPF